MTKPTTVPAYIAQFPKPTQTMLRAMRSAIRGVAPKAEEKLSYGMPYYTLNGRLAYFAGFRDHVSFFVMYADKLPSSLQAAFKRYRTGRATLQFPLGTKVPSALLRRIVKAVTSVNAQRKR